MINARGRKVGGQCRSVVTNSRTAPRRIFADAAEIAAKADARNKRNTEPMVIRPKTEIVWSHCNGRRVVAIHRKPAILQLIKA